MATNKKITIELSDANAWNVDHVAAVLKTTKSSLVSSCLKGSTNLMAHKSGESFSSR